MNIFISRYCGFKIDIIIYIFVKHMITMATLVPRKTILFLNLNSTQESNLDIVVILLITSYVNSSSTAVEL